MAWTPERIELAVSLWTSGKSASQIAREIGGVSRNAVIGKMHRLGMTKGPAQRTGLNWKERRALERRLRREAAPPKEPKANFKPKPAPKPLPPPKPVLLTGKEKPFAERRTYECAFIVTGEGEHAIACCQPTSRGAWCAAHYAIVYVPSSGMTKRDRRFIERKAA